MKIRQGFVSNSSSSSFVCQVCGEEASGWDIGLEEACMYECEYGHTFCEDHLTKDVADVTKADLIEHIEKRLKDCEIAVKKDYLLRFFSIHFPSGYFQTYSPKSA